MTLYKEKIKKRSKLRFLIGLYPRTKKYLIQSYINRIARKKGAILGKNVSIPYALAKIANANLIIGDYTSIQTDKIDLRAKVKIGSRVIIGSEVEIITCSHNIDSPEWEFKSYGIEVADYAWLATRCFILPSCRKVGKGAVCAAGSTVFKNVKDMDVVSGNPAIFLKKRKTIHYSLCTEELRGNDLLAYINAYKG
jgi:acetyltransferase-like isoleucine patch superfamily enzyme